MILLNESIGNYASNIFTKFQDKDAIVNINDGRRYTYKKLSYEIDIIAKSLLSMGITKGDHVALMSCNSPEWIIVFLATVKIGAVSVWLNYSSTQDEIDYMLKQSNSEILIVSDKNMVESINLNKFNYLKIILKMKTLFNLEFIMSHIKQISNEQLREAESKVSGSDTATILYTSGTTGKPKGVSFTHFAVLNGVRSHISNFGYTEKDRILVTLPLHHIMGGKYTALLGLISGCTLILLEKFSTKTALQSIENEKCTAFHGVPTMYQYLLNKCEGYDLSSLRVGMIAGAFSSETLMKEIMDHLHITQLFHTFGQTETLGVTQTATYDKNDSKINTVGKPVDHIEIKICNSKTLEPLPPNTEGELLVKTPYGMTEYYNNPIATNNTIIDGWIRTGDTAYIDDDGYLSIKGRLKDIIIRGGENVSPSDIENTLMKHPKIETAVVVGVPDEILGEEIFAFIKLSENSILTNDEIISYLNGKIAKYKFPKYIKFISSFPLTSTGKIQRTILKKIALNKLNENIIGEIAIN